jgi:hypothetical protein
MKTVKKSLVVGGIGVELVLIATCLMMPEMGWASKENGELLQLAQSRFDVFVTTDQRLSYQQSVASVAIASEFMRRGELQWHAFLFTWNPQKKAVT